MPTSACTGRCNDDRAEAQPIICKPSSSGWRKRTVKGLVIDYLCVPPRRYARKPSPILSPVAAFALYGPDPRARSTGITLTADLDRRELSGLNEAAPGFRAPWDRRCRQKEARPGRRRVPGSGFFIGKR